MPHVESVLDSEIIVKPVIVTFDVRRCDFEYITYNPTN